MINYATKYESKIAERFKRASITDADCGHEYTFVDPNSKTIRIGSVNTVPETEYNRTGSNRFGDVYDVGDTLQEMTCGCAPSFSFTIDALDGTDQAIEKSAAKALRRQLDEVTVPNMDKRRIKKWCMGANIQSLEATAPTKSTITGMIIDLGARMTDALVPLENRTLYIGTEYYKLLKQNPDYLGVDALGKEALTKGVVGEFDGNRVKPIPSRYMPAGVYFFIKYKGSTVDPVKLQKYDILPKVQGYSGPVVQGVTYYDSFVLGTKGDGIAVCGNATAILTAPVMAIASHAVTITAASGVVFKYTVDGTNPRYSTTAEVYTAAVELTEGQTMRAIGTKDGCVGVEGTKAYE
ncbi:chitobiase/beta-hexosaminidase C-terminal domain-containing protein [Oscillibacter sp.]|uniref:chitobiase/beta-hexosaminidase C-terminal domain-containing protein n=1 Tax=Oscillibacter sp. TaxID=1945593 RepID=UPI00289FAA9C|nr:chitobiase/beta-hexosaminidase C-terminal domain-containing protein [Oscillibacter sp.]